MKLINSIVNSNGEIESYFDDEYFSEKENKLSFKKEMLSGIPVNGTYFQLPDTPLPSVLFGGTWENVSSDYAGSFFRCEGGEAKTFEDGCQLDQFQGFLPDSEIVGYSGSAQDFTHNIYHSSYPNRAQIAHGGNNNQKVWISEMSGNKTTFRLISDGTNGTPKTGSETRPVNHTIRVWKRIS